jgi:hypothetical protein
MSGHNESDLPEVRPPAHIYKEISNTIALPQDKKDLITKFLAPLQIGKFGDSITWQDNFANFPIWVIGAVCEYQRRRAEIVRFEGETKLHKVLYFLKHYKFQNITEFFYSVMYFGPYSQDLENSIEILINDGYVKRIPKKKDKPVESFHRPNQYELTKKGNEVYMSIDKHMDESGFAKKGQILDLLVYLYKQPLDTIGSAAKWHFIWRTWSPYIRSFMDDIKKIDDLPLLPPEKLQLIVKEMPDERQLTLTEYTPYTSFYADRIFFFEGSMIPTNYFVPVNFYKNIKSVISSAAVKYNELIPSHITKIIIIYEGISESIAKCIKGNFRPEIEIYGPVSKYPQKTYNFDLSLINSGPVVILANTTLTGQSIGKLINDLESIGIRTYSVIAFADRGCGANQLFDSKKIEFECFLSKKEMLDILKWRFKQWQKLV